MQLVICDLKDALGSLDSDFGVIGGNGGSSGDIGGNSTIYQTLGGMNGPVERLSKHIKSGDKALPAPRRISMVC